MLVNPIIDVINSLMQRNDIVIVSLGMLTKGLVLAYLFYYFIFKVKNDPYKKYFWFYLICLFLWIVLFFVNRLNVLSVSDIYQEAILVFKSFFFPVTLGLLYYYIRGNGIDKTKTEKIFVFTFLVYLILLLIPFVTNTGFYSYKAGTNLGYNGWFYAANEIGPIMLILLFFAINYSYKSKLKWTFVIGIAMYLIFIIGTKVVFIGTFLILAFFLAKKLIQKNWRDVGYTALLIALAIFCITTSFTKNNLMAIMHNIDNASETTTTPNTSDQTTTNPNQSTKPTTKPNSKPNSKPNNKPSTTTKPNTPSKTPNTETTTPEVEEPQRDVLTILLSGRTDKFNNILHIYQKAPISSKILGIGFTNTVDVKDKNIESFIEIDLLDIFFHFGIVGFVIFLLPLFAFAYLIIKQMLTKFEANYFNYIFIIGLCLLISLTAGHVLSAPSVSLLLSLVICDMALLNNSKAKGK